MIIRNKKTMTLSIIIPTYNERENIKILIPQIIEIFKQNGFSGEIIVVDDNSPNGTAKEVKILAERYGNIRLIQRDEKMGLGSAYETGFKKATGDVIFEMDGDLSHDPLLIPEFVKKIEDGNDLVIGSRYVKSGGINNWGPIRIFISKSANFMANWILKLDVNDATSGYRAYKREVLSEINAGSEGYAFQVEMVYFARKKGFEMVEIPIIFDDRTMGKSKLGVREIIRFLVVVLTLALKN